MEVDLGTQLAMTSAAKTQGLAQISIIKKQHEMEMSLIAMIDEVSHSAPPPGQGARIDKLA